MSGVKCHFNFRFGLVLLMGILLFSGILALTAPSKAFAASTDCLPNGILCWRGYFYGQLDTGTSPYPGGGNVIQGGLYPNNANDLVNEIAANLNCAAYPNNQNAVGASFIVDTMLGVGPNGGDGAKLEACSRFGEWAALVHSYESAGQVNWNTPYFYTINSFYQRSRNDDAYALMSGNDPAIVFRDSAGNVLYAIRRQCGNPVGHIQGLPQLGWTFSEWTTANQATVYPGSTASFTNYAHNNGPATGYTQYYSEWQYFQGDPYAGGVAVGPVHPVNTYHGVTAFANQQTNAYTDGLTVADYGPGVNRICEHSVTYWNSSYTPGTWGVGGWSCVTILRPQPACSSVPGPDQFETLKPFSISTAVNYNDGPAGLASARATGGTYFITVTNNQTGALLPGTLSDSPSGSTWTGTMSFGPTPPSAGGEYTVKWGVAGGAGAISGCQMTITIANYPFFSVNNGDIVSGVSFATATGSTPDCSSAPHNPKAGISSWNNGTSDTPNYAGAGSQYAAMAMDLIQGFTSRQGMGGNGTTLSFSNNGQSGDGYTSTDTGQSLFGGMFGSVANCIDYWATKPDLTTLAAPNSNVGSNASGTYAVTSGDLRLNGGAIPNGRHIVIYVKGNVYISGNIMYQGSVNPTYASIRDIPSFKLVVQGSIFIDPSVQYLDGVYVAVPGPHYDSADPLTATNNFTNPDPGTITTCADPTSAGGPYRSEDAAQASVNNLYGICSQKQLIVHGAFVANQLYLLRTVGTRSTNTPAEQFIFSPETWLSLSDGGSGKSGTYQAFTSLPPVL